MKNKGLGIKATVMIVLALFVVLQAMVVTKPGEYKVIKQLGKIVRVEENSNNSYGISLRVPFLQSEQTISSKMHLSDLAPSDVLTSDKKSMISDCFVMWRVADPVKFIQQLSGSVTNAESRITSNIYTILKNQVSNLTQEELISGRDGELALALKEASIPKLAPFGIEILGVETKRLDLPDENKDAVYNRMISERNNIAATYTADGAKQAKEIKNSTSEQETIILANANKEAEKLIAEGQAEYMRILSEAYNDPAKADFYRFVRQLDAVEATLKTGTNKIVLDKNSPIAEIFY